MFTAIENLAGGAVGFEAHGRVSGKDRLGFLEPEITTAMKAGHKLRLLYVAAPDFDGYDDGGAYDEAVFGSRHSRDFDRIAFVAEEGPYARSVTAVGGLMPATVRVFAPTEIVAAKEWLAARDR